MCEVGCQVVGGIDDEGAQLDRPLAEHVARLGKRRRVGLAYLQHAPVELHAARCEALTHRQAADQTRRHVDRATFVAKPPAPHEGALAAPLGPGPG